VVEVDRDELCAEVADRSRRRLRAGLSPDLAPRLAIEASLRARHLALTPQPRVLREHQPPQTLNWLARHRTQEPERKLRMDTAAMSPTTTDPITDKNIELKSDECEILFRIVGERNDHIYFDIEVTFRRVAARVPPIRGGSLSRRDAERLVRYISETLQEPAEDDLSNERSDFRTYDGFFVLSIGGDGTACFMLNYEPSYRCSIGVECPFSEMALRQFREGWVALLERR
jgi:hypothetical protein